MKLVDDTQLDSDLTSVANAIRAKTGGSSQLAFPAGFVSGIGGLADPSGTTATASDVASGKYFLDSSGVLTQGTASGGGGGGSTKTEIGTFKFSTEGLNNINLTYSGTGWPIALLIFPSSGMGSETTFGSTTQRYAVGLFLTTKGDTSLQPGYSGTSSSLGYYLTYYKSSSSSATSYQSSGGTISMFYSSGATSNVANCAVFKSTGVLSVYVAASSSKKGFMAGIDYTYVIGYSA